MTSNNRYLSPFQYSGNHLAGNIKGMNTITKTGLIIDISQFLYACTKMAMNTATKRAENQPGMIKKISNKVVVAIQTSECAHITSGWL